MATAAMHHIMPKLHIGSSRDKDGRKESRSEASANNRAREEEKSRLLAWEAHKQPLEYEQILVEPNSKPVGHSSKVLRREDFDLVKTLGTGMRPQPEHAYSKWSRIADQVGRHRHICKSMACESRHTEERRCRQSLRSQDFAQDRCHSSEAGRTRPQRTQCPSLCSRPPLHHDNGGQLPRPRHPIHAGKSL